ncbi:MAG TPA: AAA family ATPase, partial [Cryptosporangiaceae bacterium]|nr:AAA family ATPase [Cryptosporangiaceae bacterium]
MRWLMLRSFRFANHRSFSDQQELLLLPVYEKESRPAALTVAGLYGANASGKTNVLDALGFMVAAVRDSYRRWDPEDRIPREPFRLRPGAADEPSWFEVDVVAGGVRYVYGFALNDTEVVEEWLHSYPRGKKRNLFTRAEGAVEFGGSVTGHKSALEDLTRPNALMLSMAAHVGLEAFLPIYRWFRRSVRFVDPDAHRSPPSAHGYRSLAERSPELAERLAQLVTAADVGISEIRIEADPQVENYEPEVAMAFETRMVAQARYEEVKVAASDDESAKRMLPEARGRLERAEARHRLLQALRKDAKVPEARRESSR